MSCRIKALIVDEEPLVCQAMLDILEDQGHEVRAVTSASDACELLFEPYDVLFLHRRLPESRCDEIVRLAREHGNDPAVVLMSSEQAREVEKNKLRLGAVEIVYKPLDPLSIRALIDRHVRDQAPSWDLEDAPRILIVDDQELVLHAVQDILEERYSVVVGTRSPEDALDKLRQAPFEILLTDLRMEEMSGIELIRAAKNLRPALQALVMTGYASKDTAIAALKEGAFDFLEKPLSPDIVLQTVARTWKLTRYEIENRCLLAALRQSNEELTMSRDAALAASRLKSQLLTNMSHEVRTPLNGVLGALSLLHDRVADAEQKKFVELAQRSGIFLLGVLDNVLSLAELEAGAIELQTADFAVDALLKRVVDLFQERATKAGLTLVVQVAENVPRRLVGCAARIEQILSQLLDNACKFTEKGAVSLDVQLAERDDPQPQLRFTVQDTGIGLEEELRDKIFEPFVQGDGSLTRRYGGVGIGLAICRRLIEHLAGSIGVDSHLGHGSRFWFVIPFSPSKSAEDSPYEIA